MDYIRTTPLKREELLIMIFIALLKNDWSEENKKDKQLMLLFPE